MVWSDLILYNKITQLVWYDMIWSVCVCDSFFRFTHLPIYNTQQAPETKKGRHSYEVFFYKQNKHFPSEVKKAAVWKSFKWNVRLCIQPQFPNPPAAEAAAPEEPVTPLATEHHRRPMDRWTHGESTWRPMDWRCPLIRIILLTWEFALCKSAPFQFDQPLVACNRAQTVSWFQWTCWHQL